VLATHEFQSPYSGCSVPLTIKVEPKGACARCHVGPDATLKNNLNATFDLGSLAAWTARLDPEGTATDAERREAQTWLLGQGVARPAGLGVAGRKSPRSSSLEKLCTGDMPPPDSAEEKALTAEARAALIAGLKTACADLIGEAKCKEEFPDCYKGAVKPACDLEDASCSPAEFCAECGDLDPGCDLCQTCGDGECDGGGGEDQLTCAADCGPFAGACMGACGSYVEANDCWCDDACAANGDCCLGVFSDCG
jgi:hypothetical protein